MRCSAITLINCINPCFTTPVIPASFKLFKFKNWLKASIHSIGCINLIILIRNYPRWWSNNCIGKWWWSKTYWTNCLNKSYLWTNLKCIQKAMSICWLNSEYYITNTIYFCRINTHILARLCATWLKEYSIKTWRGHRPTFPDFINFILYNSTIWRSRWWTCYWRVYECKNIICRPSHPRLLHIYW